MKKNLLKLIAVTFISALIVGCGSSGSSASSSDSDNNGGADDNNETAPVVDPRRCEYITPGDQIINIGDDFNASATAKDGNGEDVVVTTSGTDDVNTSQVGTYIITFSSVSCDNNGTTTIKVEEAEEEGGTIDPADLLPF